MFKFFKYSYLTLCALIVLGSIVAFCIAIAGMLTPHQEAVQLILKNSVVVVLIGITTCVLLAAINLVILSYVYNKDESIFRL